MSKRIFDILFSLVGIAIISPFLLIIAIIIRLDSSGSVFYRQIRIGRYGKEFKILKFRTMITNADKIGKNITTRSDNRITRIGKVLRKCKADELPQLFNVLMGEMSFVGPRPEVPEYVNLYTPEQRKILDIRPGITDYASLKFRNENELLSSTIDSEKLYIEKIMPYKLELNRKYIENMSLLTDIKLIIQTVFSVFKGVSEDVTEEFKL